MSTTTTHIIGTRWNILAYARTTFGPVRFKLLDQNENPWPVLDDDTVTLWVKDDDGDPNVDAVIEKEARLVDEPSALYELIMTPAEMIVAEGDYVHQIIHDDGTTQRSAFFGRFRVRERVPD